MPGLKLGRRRRRDEDDDDDDQRPAAPRIATYNDDDDDGAAIPGIGRGSRRRREPRVATYDDDDDGAAIPGIGRGSRRRRDEDDDPPPRRRNIKGRRPRRDDDDLSSLAQASFSEARDNLFDERPRRRRGKEDDAPRLLFGTVDGAVGCILPISADEYAFFRSLEKALASVAPAVGDLPHDEWRAFANERKQSPARGFVDGDLVETLVDLKGAQLERVVALMKEDGCECTAASLVERVEDMARSH